MSFCLSNANLKPQTMRSNRVGLLRRCAMIDERVGGHVEHGARAFSLRAGCCPACLAGMIMRYAFYTPPATATAGHAYV